MKIRSHLVLIRRTAAALLVLLCSSAIMAGCAVQTEKTLSNEAIQRLQVEFKPGVSSKADVLLLLGEPHGPGALGGFHAMRGPEHAKKGPADAWYYEDNRSSGLKTISHHLQVLVIFFEGDTYNGFFLFSSDATGKSTFE